MKNTLLQQLSLNNFWSLNKTLCRSIGVSETLLLQHFIDLQYKIFNGKEFFQQQERIVEELGLGLKQVKTIINKLVELNIISCVKRGVPAKNYYSINEDEVIKLLSSTKEEVKLDNIKKEKTKVVSEYQKDIIVQPEEDFTSNNEYKINKYKIEFTDEELINDYNKIKENCNLL